MKNLFLLGLLVSTTSFSQITDENGISATGQGNATLIGKIGIGTSNPSTDLDINGEIKSEKIILTNSVADGAVFTDYTDRNLQCRVIAAGKEFTVDQSLFNFWDFPQSNLNSVSVAAFVIEDRNFKSRFKFNAHTASRSDLFMYDKNQSEFFNLSEDGDSNVVMRLAKDNSYVMIGTNSYIDSDEIYKLSVEGKVRAHGVKVYTDWADFVFEKNYNLPSLEEVERYINENGHLMDIPSAKEVKKNGIELGEMNKLLLQKIEELTLHVIALKKEIDTIKSKNQ
ncbi:MAG TPA: hypothetical protein VFF15_00865 [Flavobacteriaceae bacterium]|nr:hypothetical protein [Flavobacteriaceae bacterium]